MLFNENQKINSFVRHFSKAMLISPVNVFINFLLQYSWSVQNYYNKNAIKSPFFVETNPQTAVFLQNINQNQTKFLMKRS